MLRACLHPAEGKRELSPGLPIAPPCLPEPRGQGSAHPHREASSSDSSMCSAPKMALFSLTWLFFFLFGLMAFQSISSITEGASQASEKVQACPEQHLQGVPKADARWWGGSLSWTCKPSPGGARACSVEAQASSIQAETRWPWASKVEIAMEQGLRDGGSAQQYIL